ncbi:MAG: PAS domain S-box protein [Aliarcobacter sp.]|jgi:PAS domain S-box-containing protein|nr:PAS domain S-box protein [Aliarcobacter sp.]
MTNNKLLSASLEVMNNVFFNTLPVCVVVWKNNEFYSIESISKNISKVLGFKQADFINKKVNYSDLIHPDDLEKVLLEVKKNTEERKSKFSHEPYRIKNSKGSYKWIKNTVSIIYETNNITHLIGFISDCTIEKESLLEKELEKTKLSTIIHSLPDLLWIKDQYGKYLACNKRFEDFYGAKESEIIGKTDQDFVSLELSNFFRKHDLKAIKSDIPLSNYEELIFASDGHKEYSHTIKSKVILNDGTLYGILGISRNISQIKIYQDKIEEQKEEFETIFNSSKDGIAILDLESNFLNCNKAYCEMLDYSKKELLTKSCIDLTIPEEREKSIEVMKRIIEDGFVTNFEKICLTKDKHRKIYVNMAATLLPDKKRVLLVSKNVSDVKFLEEQSKLAAMGEMIGNIAHQWRQPLSIISTISTGILLQKELGVLTDELFISDMKNINESAQYLSKTIDDFRNFIKNDESIELTSIKDALDYTIHLAEASLNNNYINLVVNYDGDIKIPAVKNELVQSFLNIINNAKDALVSNNKEENRYIFITTKKIKNILELSINDSGGGIAEKNIERIFEPYFTTKYKSTGTGIGLSMVHKILRNKYHAEIIVFNDNFIYNDISYYGACFRILFKEKSNQ